MDQEIAKTWVAALRGELLNYHTGKPYEQAKGALCDAEGKMCPLGVLIDIADDGTDWEQKEEGREWWAQGRSAFPSFYFLAKIGSSSQRMIRIALMNDGGASFAEIADEIEKEIN